MKLNLLMALCVTVCSTAVPAFADTWSAAYGGTIVVTDLDGNVSKIYVEPDHSYTIAMSNGTRIEGTWADTGVQSCFTQTNPPPPDGVTPVCFPTRDYKVGEAFKGETVNKKFTSVIEKRALTENGAERQPIER